MDFPDFNTIQKSIQNFVAKLRGQKPQNASASHWMVYPINSDQYAVFNLKQTDGIISLDKILLSDPAERNSSASIKKNLQTLMQQPENSKFHPLIRSSISGQGVITRLIQMPKMSLENLKSSLTYEMDKYIPFKAADVIWDLFPMAGFSKNAERETESVLLVAAKKEDLLPWVETLQGASLRIDCLDLDCLAVINSLCFLHPEVVSESAGILVVGKDLTHFAVIASGEPRFIRDISFGIADVIKRLKRKLDFNEQAAVQILQDLADSKQAPETLKQTLEEIFLNLSGDLKISIDYYTEQVTGAQKLSKIYVCGDLTESWFVDLLSAQSGIPAVSLDVFEKLTIGPEVDAALVRKCATLLPVILGLAVRDL